VHSTTKKHVTANLMHASNKTSRKELFWLKGKKEELEVYRIPIHLLYFNIENGRYADKMIQLQADNPGAHIDPRNDQWKEKIGSMLRGQYPGTLGDRGPYENLRSDILSKQQLKPGVVLFDGGVLDGNRRLAVLLDLAATEKNPSRFEYFEGVILPEDVGADDRWRIEAGLQIGRDEKLAYSPINQLLKIREGLKLFRNLKNPEHEIAQTLYGIPESEIRRDIRKIQLIDEYLEFVGRPNAYNEIGPVIERFEEAIKAVDNAKKLSWMPADTKKLKGTLFAIIRDQSMDNWEMRYITKAMGSVSGKGKKGLLQNKKVLLDFLKIGESTTLRKDLSSKGAASPEKSKHDEISKAFIDQMEAHENRSKPLFLAERARNALAALLDALSDGAPVHGTQWQQNISALPKVLKMISGLTKDCSRKLSSVVKH
jgi:hypothetical protein